MRQPPQRKLDKRVVTAWRLEYALATLIIDAILIFGGFMLSAFNVARFPFLIVAIVVSVLVAVVYIGIVPTFRYARWRFEVTKDEIDIMEGILIRKRTIIPLVRVQSVDTSQGPILRMLDISTVRIATAAGGHDIPALSQDEAATLRDHISALARVAQEDV